ncbi:MAG TPA: AMP-binding protein [Solirubrobacteraceae bacterium]|nr:AMP-binding protein [Solirubrobacteraceae bacterium]
MNFARDVVDAAAPGGRALLEVAADGERREWTFGEVSDRAARLAGTLAAHGVGRGDVVMTLAGNRPEWVLAMVACFRLGAVVLPCTEQLRAKDLRHRLNAAKPKLILADPRNRTELEAARPHAPILDLLDASLYEAAQPAEAVDLEPEDPSLITFTSGTAGEPKGVVHGQRYLSGQRLQAEHWLDARPGELVWCTAASGWSKSARNAFIAPWLRGAAGMLHDARFDPAQRLELLAREEVNVLCMAPTEYRVIAKRAEPRPLPRLRGLVAAGEALNAEVLRVWEEATGLAVRDGYGQTETGHLTANPPGRPPRPGSMGLPLPGVDLRVEPIEEPAGRGEPDPARAGRGRHPAEPDPLDARLSEPGAAAQCEPGETGELVLADPGTDPTFFLGYLADGPAPAGPWRTGDRVVCDEDGYLHFEGRADDVIVSAGYRIGPFEVESALVEHAAVAEAAVVAAPDDERGSVVRAVVVLRDGYAPGDGLRRELQEHVRAQTAPYKYPRIVDFAAELPKTASGKVRRALLRSGA